MAHFLYTADVTTVTAPVPALLEDLSCAPCARCSPSMYACHPKCTEQRSGNQKLQHALHWCDYCHLHLIKCFLLQAALVPKCKATDSLWHSWHYCGKRPMPFGTSMLLTHARSSVGFFFSSFLLSLLTSLAEFQSHCNALAFSNRISCFLTLTYLESSTCSVG